MRFRIIEPTFFLHKQRRVGEVMEAPVGPYRNVAGAFGLTRIPQFVEMPEEIKEIIQTAAQGAMPPQLPGAAAPGATFADAAAAVLKPAPPAAKLKGNPLAARIRSLTTRQAKFEDQAAKMLTAGEHAMTKIEADGPAILQNAVNNAADKLAALTDLGDSLKEMAANGDPLEG